MITSKAQITDAQTLKINNKLSPNTAIPKFIEFDASWNPASTLSNDENNKFIIMTWIFANNVKKAKAPASFIGLIGSIPEKKDIAIVKQGSIRMPTCCKK